VTEYIDKVRAEARRLFARDQVDGFAQSRAYDNRESAILKDSRLYTPVVSSDKEVQLKGWVVNDRT